MTRKRFVKLLMADGYSRNGANNIARGVAEKGETFARAYAAEQALKKLVDAIDFERMGATIARWAKALGEVTAAVARAAADVTEKMRAANFQT